MYPDPITPRAHPDKLRQVSYDPFGLMPRELPPPPRVFLNARQLLRAREMIQECPWAKQAFELLVKNCRQELGLPKELPVPAQAPVTGKAAWLAERNALAALLTGEAEFRARAIETFRLLARGFRKWPVTGGDIRAFGGGLAESRGTLSLGRTYDSLAATGPDADDALFREMLQATAETSDGAPHRACGNHNTGSLVGRLGVAVALGDLQGIHDALYGCPSGGAWRYGLIHQLRHDLLSDGIHWERTPGYHFYTLMGLTEMALMLQNIGVDVWHAELPTLKQDDLCDLHRAYGPAGRKCLKAAFDAPLYYMFPNGDFTLLHDSGLANIRDVYIWGILYDQAYEAYGDEKYAWLLNWMERQHGTRQHAGLPMPLQTASVDLDFARLRRTSYPPGRFSQVGDCRISLSGRHEFGCTLFPVHGSFLLRGDPARTDAPGAYLFYGPHTAGHQSPAALHLDVHGAGRRLTSSPSSYGYEDPEYLTWVRTTIAHNTVTVDERAMFPYDGDGDSIWEADRWRDSISDGELLLFQPGEAFKAARAINENVYPGVRLDRTVVVTAEMVLDVYRVLGEGEHQYDWAMHLVDGPVLPDGAARVELGTRRGYCHLKDARRLPPWSGTVALRWQGPAGSARTLLVPPAGAEVIVAGEPFRKPDADYPKVEDGDIARHALIVRARGRGVLFVALWPFGKDQDAGLKLIEAAPDAAVVVETVIGKTPRRWRLPFETGPVRED